MKQSVSAIMLAITVSFTVFTSFASAQHSSTAKEIDTSYTYSIIADHSDGPIIASGAEQIGVGPHARRYVSCRRYC